MNNFDKKSNPQPARETDHAFEHIKRFKEAIEHEQFKVGQDTSDGWLEVSQEVADYYHPKGLGINPQTGKPNVYFIREGIHCYLPGKKEEVQAQMAKTTQDIMGDPQPGVSMLKT